MQILKRILLAAIALVLLLFALPTASAQTVQEQTPAKIHIAYEYGGTPIPDAAVYVYRVGNIHSNGAASLRSPYSAYPIDTALLYSDPQQTAKLLYHYILLNQVSPDAVLTTGDNGRVSGNFSVGLYLVVPQNHCDSNGLFRSEPSLVSLPYRAAAADSWAYDVTYFPKSSFTPYSRLGTISLYVTKKWEKDTASQRPKEITVCLLRNGTLVDEVKLNEKNRWIYCWQDLSEYHDWRVVEKPVSGYTVTMSGNTSSVLLTNTAEETVPETTRPTTAPTQGSSSGSSQKLPQTGMLWWPVPVLLCLGLALILLGIGIRRGAAYET